MEGTLPQTLSAVRPVCAPVAVARAQVYAGLGTQTNVYSGASSYILILQDQES